MSHITFTGNLADDPELIYTRTGRPVVRLVVIENRRVRKDDGYEDGEPNVFRVEAWSHLAENAAASLKKGSRVHVEGHIVTDRWTDKKTGDPRTGQHVVASELSHSLRFHTVTATKAQAPAQDAPADEPWDTAVIPDGDTPF